MSSADDPADPFLAASLRSVVLDAWTASTDRFREDANAEADLALGAYRDRVVVELAQNAADAAVRAGGPGDLLLRCEDGDDDAGSHGALVAANTGAVLDAAGVRALASLRASAKRSGGSEASGSSATVGRFGVGFAAVLAVSDEPRVLSTDGGVAFSRRRTREALAATGSSALAAETSARSDDVPVLRLPWPDDEAPPQGYDTAVVLPLRDAEARERVLAALRAVGDPLLLALPALGRITVELPGAAPRVLDDVGSRWRTLRRTGSFAAADLVGLPVEEAQRAGDAGWSVTWALPRGGVPLDLPGVLLAPTPTDEPLPWPAVLVVGAPLDASRRALAPGPSAEVVLAAAAGAYAALLVERAAGGEDALDLVPAGLPSGAVDADLRVRLLALLPAAALLAPVVAPGDSAEGPLLRPRDAVMIDGPLADDPAALEPLAPLVGGLVAAPLRHRALLAALGATTTTVADVVDAMPLTVAAATWRGWVRALAGFALDPAGREQLALLPVPLAGGGGVRGPRGLLLPPSGGSADEGALAGPLAVLATGGLRAVDPDAVAESDAADLLVRLGSVPASARAVLEDPSVARVIAAADDPDAAAQGAGLLEEDAPGVDDVAQAVLTLVSRAIDDGELRPGDLPVLADLLLPAEDGEPWPAAGLVVPGSAAARLLDPDEVAPLAAAVLDRWGSAVLEAVGVATTLGVLRLGEVDADDPPDALLDVDGGEEWLQVVCPDAPSPVDVALADVVLVRDLDLVLPERRSELLALVAADTVLRAAVLEPVGVVTGGVASSAPSHAAWWLGRELDVAARADPDAPEALRRVLGEPDGAVAAADPALRRALGTVSGWDQVPAGAWGQVLDRSLSAGVGVPGLLGLWAALADAAREGATLDPPDRLVALDPAGGAPVVVSAEDVVVVDDPRWLQVASLGPRLVVGGADAEMLADVLDVDLASERGRGTSVTSTGHEREVPPLVRETLDGCPPTWVEHKTVSVDVAGTTERVGWWVEEGVVHADGLAALACALAAASGDWDRRPVLAEVLAALDRGDEAAALAALVSERAGTPSARHAAGGRTDSPLGS